jgi:hypothetical protein
MLNKRRRQLHIRPNKICEEPTLIEGTAAPSNVSTPSNQGVDQDLLMAVCLPCYNEEWSEISGTLRSLAANILYHRKKINKTFQLHVVVFLIQDGWDKAAASTKKGIHDEFGYVEKCAVYHVMEWVF